MPVREEILQAQALRKRFRQGRPSDAARRRFAVVTCMDARIDPAKALGLEEGDAHVIRNAGGLVTDDALRSLVISHWLLGTQEFSSSHTPTAGWSRSRRPAREAP